MSVAKEIYSKEMATTNVEQLRLAPKFSNLAGNERRKSSYIFIGLGFLFLPAVIAIYFGIQVHVVTSGSMRPGTQPGGVLITHLVQANEVKVGQVILLFNNTTQSVDAHRVQSINEENNLVSFIGKGDNNAVVDAVVIQPSTIKIETVFTVIPYLGYLISWLNSIWGIAILLMYLILSAYFTLRNRKKNQSYKLHSELIN